MCVPVRISSDFGDKLSRLRHIESLRQTSSGTVSARTILHPSPARPDYVDAPRRTEPAPGRRHRRSRSPIRRAPPPIPAPPATAPSTDCFASAGTSASASGYSQAAGRDRSASCGGLCDHHAPSPAVIRWRTPCSHEMETMIYRDPFGSVRPRCLSLRLRRFLQAITGLGARAAIRREL